MNPNTKQQEYVKSIGYFYDLIRCDYYDKSRGKTINRYKGNQAPILNTNQQKA